MLLVVLVTGRMYLELSGCGYETLHYALSYISRLGVSNLAGWQDAMHYLQGETL